MVAAWCRKKGESMFVRYEFCDWYYCAGGGYGESYDRPAAQRREILSAFCCGSGDGLGRGYGAGFGPRSGYGRGNGEGSGAGAGEGYGYGGGTGYGCGNV